VTRHQWQTHQPGPSPQSPTIAPDPTGFCARSNRLKNRTPVRQSPCNSLSIQVLAWVATGYGGSGPLHLQGGRSLFKRLSPPRPRLISCLISAKNQPKTLKMTSISREAFNGRELTPRAARAWRPFSPKMAIDNSEAPSRTQGCL
jgi:hypothetical protein